MEIDGIDDRVDGEGIRLEIQVLFSCIARRPGPLRPGQVHLLRISVIINMNDDGISNCRLFCLFPDLFHCPGSQGHPNRLYRLDLISFRIKEGDIDSLKAIGLQLFLFI